MYHKIPTSTYGNGQGISSRQWQPWRFRASRRPSRFVRQIFEEGSIRMLLSHFCKQECLRIRNVYACNPSRKYPEEIHCFSNCQQLQRAQKPYFMEIFASELSTIHSETLMDMSSARELEGKSSIEGLGTSSLHNKTQLELIAVVIGSSVMNWVRHSMSCSDAILRYVWRIFLEFADVSISENEKNSAYTETPVKARIAIVNHTR